MYNKINNRRKIENKFKNPVDNFFVSFYILVVIIEKKKN